MYRPIGTMSQNYADGLYNVTRIECFRQQNDVIVHFPTSSYPIQIKTSLYGNTGEFYYRVFFADQNMWRSWYKISASV